jgi:hypothetical protein
MSTKFMPKRLPPPFSWERKHARQQQATDDSAGRFNRREGK